jgi:Tfp pilus assembly protein PilF
VPVTVLHTPQPAAQPVATFNSQQAALLCRTTGEGLEKQGYTAEATRQYENARAHDPQLKGVSRRLAVLYDLQGDTQRAEAEYQRALTEHPGDAELLNDLGYFHYRHDRVKDAEKWLRNAVSVDPNCRCAWINLGQVLARQKRFDESFQAFAHVLRPAEAYSNLGVLLAKQGRTEEARTAFQQAANLDPTLKQPKAFLGALSRSPALLPPGITRTPKPESPAVAREVASPRIVTKAPISPPTPAPTGKPPEPAITRDAPRIIQGAAPAPPAPSIPPTVREAKGRSPAPMQDSLPTIINTPPVPGAARPTPTVNGAPSSLPDVRQSSQPTPPPAPPSVVRDTLPNPPGTPQHPISPAAPASPMPAFLPSSVASALPVKPHTAPETIKVTAKAKPVAAEGPVLPANVEKATDADSAGRPPIVILTDCERSREGSSR